MEDSNGELDSVKHELEKLKAEYQVKIELFEILKKAHYEKSLKFEEAREKIMEQSKELNVKNEEIEDATLRSEMLDSCLKEKELSLKNLCSLNENVRADIERKMTALEGENRNLVSTLDEVKNRNEELEQVVCANRKQIEGLKSQLLVFETKCLEAERTGREAQDLKRRSLVMVELEKEKNEFQDKLKWKEEKFEHLEEAHKKLQDQFRTTKEDWDREKSVLVEETCTLQSRLDSQARAVEGLQTRLEMCNNALAHEESKRRSLEIQVSDFESRFQKVCSQFEEERSEIQRLTFERTEEISKLRNMLGLKVMVEKETELRIAHLEQENKELIVSLKELQEDQIRNAGTGLSAKLHSKLRRLERIHSSCSSKLKERESELFSQIEQIKEKVEGKEEEIKKLKMELENCNCRIQELNEEISMLLAIMKSELSEAYMTTYSVKAEMEQFNKEKDDNISLLTARLAMSCCTTETACNELEEEERKKDSNKYEDLLQQIVVLEGELSAQAHQMEAGVEAEENSAKIVKEKEICIQNLRKDIALLKQESGRRELEAATLAQFDSERGFIDEKKRLFRVILDKEQRLKNLEVFATALERDLTSAVISSYSDAIEKQVKIDAFSEALENQKYAMDLEIKEKIKLITHLEKEVCDLQLSLTQKEKSLSSMGQEAEQLQELLESNELKVKKSIEEQRNMEAIIKQLVSNKESLRQENSKLSVERDGLLAFIQKVCDAVGQLANEDLEMMGTLGKLLPTYEKKIEPGVSILHEFHDPTEENAGTYFSSTTIKTEACSNARSPLKEVNL